MLGREVEAEWVPHTEATWRIFATSLPNNEVIITYGQDAEQQLRSVYIKLWTFDEGTTDWENLSTLQLMQSHVVPC